VDPRANSNQATAEAHASGIHDEKADLLWVWEVQCSLARTRTRILHKGRARHLHLMQPPFRWQSKCDYHRVKY
jgi:hypothetical protein